MRGFGGSMLAILRVSDVPKPRPIVHMTEVAVQTRATNGKAVRALSQGE